MSHQKYRNPDARQYLNLSKGLALVGNTLVFGWAKRKDWRGVEDWTTRMRSCRDHCPFPQPGKRLDIVCPLGSKNLHF